MIDRTKLRKGLAYCPGVIYCLDYNMDVDCPYGEEDCIGKMHDEMLSLLKPVRADDYIIEETKEIAEKCGACSAVICGEPNFCPFCGQEVDRRFG